MSSMGGGLLAGQGGRPCVGICYLRWRSRSVATLNRYNFEKLWSVATLKNFDPVQLWSVATLKNFDQLQLFRKKMNLPPLDLKWDKPCVGICYMQRVRGVRYPEYLCCVMSHFLIRRGRQKRRFSRSRRSVPRKSPVWDSATSLRFVANTLRGKAL